MNLDVDEGCSSSTGSGNVTEVDLGFAVGAENVKNSLDASWKEWPAGWIGGGNPKWLVPFGLESVEELDVKEFRCDSCGAKLSFLLQIYAPIDEIPSAFHRVLYVFVCRNKSTCLAQGGGVKCFRMQLPRKNKYYPFDGTKGEEKPVPCSKTTISLGPGFLHFGIVTEPEPVAIEESHTDGDRQRLCAVCRKGSRSKCGGCAAVWYCSREHQAQDWKSHKLICKMIRDASKDVGDDDDEDIEQSNLDSIAAGQDAKISSMLNNKDETFEAFQSRLKRAPEQILRYSRWPKELGDEDSGPLWLSSVNDPRDIPVCQHCGGARDFEMQIMPQLLHKLAEHEIDWGIICIYTCIKSCPGGAANEIDRLNLIQEFCLVEHARS